MKDLLFEAHNYCPYCYNRPQTTTRPLRLEQGYGLQVADLKDESSLMDAIAEFEMLPASIDAKFKLSQNRSQEDQDGIINGLSGRTDEMSQRVKELMAKSTS